MDTKRGHRKCLYYRGIHIKRVEFRENVRDFFPQGQLSKLSLLNNEMSALSMCPWSGVWLSVTVKFSSVNSLGSRTLSSTLNESVSNFLPRKFFYKLHLCFAVLKHFNTMGNFSYTFLIGTVSYNLGTAHWGSNVCLLGLWRPPASFANIWKKGRWKHRGFLLDFLCGRGTQREYSQNHLNITLLNVF